MTRYRKSTFNVALLFVLALLFSCENELEFSKDKTGAFNQPNQRDAIIMSPINECPLLTGYADWDGITMVLGEERTFAIEPYSAAIYKWTTSGNAIVISSSDITNTVTVKASSLGTASLSVTRDANEGGTCGRTGTIKVIKSGGGGGALCACPSPFIDDQLCVSGGHPHWRFELTGVSSSDDIYWYGNHISILTGQGQTYVVAKPTDPNNGYFTLYCRVTKTCRNGTKSSRTAFYTNLYGGNCGGGTTGYTGGCGGPILD